MSITEALGAQRLAAEQRRHRHRWEWGFSGQDPSTLAVRCVCGAIKDEQKSRRGKSARSRGNRRELEIAKALGGTKVGQYGLPEDVRAGMFVIQSKVRKAFPTWMTTELAKLPRTDGRIPLLVVTDSPGPGHRRRCIVVMELTDFRDLHGEDVG